MSYFEYQSKNLFYQEMGTGKPLLLLHGNTASSNMFLEIAQKFKHRYQVILLDFLGHGKSDRLETFPIDLWYEEAQQVIKFLEFKNYKNIAIIGSSGGALVAINVALERPDLVGKIIVDSFEGEKPIASVTEHIVQDRELSKQNMGARMFYQAMQGEDWEDIVDHDTEAIYQHAKTIGRFFHQPLEHLQADILMTGSYQDEFFMGIDQAFCKKTYTKMLNKIGHGSMYLFDKGGHPAMLSNQEEFVEKAISFLEKE